MVQIFAFLKWTADFGQKHLIESAYLIFSCR
nr:MAG TPA: hypothetical protein [Caudoviricetes sp.]